MYLSNKKSRAVFQARLAMFRGLSSMQLSLAGYAGMSGLQSYDWSRAALVSRSYGSGTVMGGGKVRHFEDDGSGSYDTAPVGTATHRELYKYKETLNDRGDYFMGCKREMQLGCPSSTLQQDNPFGDFVNREGN